MNNLLRRRMQLAALAAHLSKRREAILLAWRQAAARDSELSTPTSISRAQFDDHIPEVLDAFERQLRTANPADIAKAQSDEKEGAAEHGLQRWQQGYDHRETMLEWGHLHLCLLEEIERYGAQHPELASTAVPFAVRALAHLCNTGVCESAARYLRMQRAEAASRVQDLERALEHLKALERQRAEVLREAAHDLRGSVSVITNVTSILNRSNTPELARARFYQMLEKGVTSLQELLTDLMDLARLEAGHERRNVTQFDAAPMLRDFCETLRPAAAERNLLLQTEGPKSLWVEGDVTKIQRIVQNLVLNSLKVTERGEVCVSWQEHGTAEWLLCVQDTGPGFKPGSSRSISGELAKATQLTHEIEEQASLAAAGMNRAEALLSQSPHDTKRPSGEGIGLSIVKRLCELLNASIELESAAGEGATFRIRLPRRYTYD
jgi:signal transduction histidine kinase